MKALQRRYPKTDFNNITEKDIIYFCRDALSVYNTNTEKHKKLLEKQILEIIKSKEWDWSAQDIDDNTILTYPMFNNGYSIVEYLIENKKYNLSQYDKEVSESVCACISLVGDKNINFILNRSDVDKQYKTDMAIRCYLMSMRVPDECNKANYLEKASLIIKNDASFDRIVEDFIIKHEFYENKASIFRHLLDNHPLETDRKIFLLDNLFNPELWKKRKLAEEIRQTYEKWKIYYELQHDLSNTNTSDKKLKI